VNCLVSLYIDNHQKNVLEVEYIYVLSTTMKILSYNEFLTSTCNTSPGELHFSNLTEAEKTEKIENSIRGDVHLIWKKLILPINNLLESCPYCKNKTTRIHKKTISFPGFETQVHLFKCKCGWWGIGEYGTTKNINFLHSDSRNKIIAGILKSYEIDSNKIPVNTLNEVLAKDNSNLFKIHPTKLEEIVQHVFSSYYNCEVIHCGKSHDGGIDLMLINSEKPTLIQVKRRTKPDHIESVSTVRDLLGAMFINDTQKGMIVSTANRFSRPSNKIANFLIERGKVEVFELVDFKKFCEMLTLVNTYKMKESWEKLIEDI